MEGETWSKSRKGAQAKGERYVVGRIKCFHTDENNPTEEMLKIQERGELQEHDLEQRTVYRIKYTVEEVALARSKGS